MHSRVKTKIELIKKK